MVKVQGKTSWRGLAAVYTAMEREAIAPLPVNEQFVLHSLKAYFGGEIHPDETSRSPKPETSPVYIDAEDIPFGEPVTSPPVRRSKRSYALQWTNGRGSVHPLKKTATRRMRAWVNWKRRQGWNVITHPTGYFAGKDHLREAILIKERPQ